MTHYIHPISYVKESAEQAAKLSKIDIYRGLLDPNSKIQISSKAKEIRPISPGEFGKQFELFEKNNFGDFTAIFFPSRESYHFSLKGNEIMNGIETPNFQGIPTEEQVKAQVEKILENERLKQRLAELEEEQENNSMWGNRMGIALEMLVGNLLGIPSKNVNDSEPVLQGTEINTENMNETEQALVILVQKFGEEWLQKFAKKIQAEPGLVNQIKNFFS